MILSIEDTQLEMSSPASLEFSLACSLSEWLAQTFKQSQKEELLEKWHSTL